MTPQYSKVKGRSAEVAVVQYLNGHGYPYAERRRLEGANDRGDIAGFPGLVIEVKAERTYKPKGWLREAATEAGNAGGALPVVWFKLNGVTDPAEWGVLMSGRSFAEFVLPAGWDVE